MITSIFSKSKPINFIIVFFVMLLAFLVARLELTKESITMLFIGKQLVLLFTCYLSILLLNFIVSKNSLTKQNNYEILLFSLFLLLIPSTTINANILFSNFFVLLSLRRIMSLRSQRSEKQKLFDAAFWIAIASLFYFWSILFFALIPIALALYTDNNIKHWVIPFIGVATVFVISVAISLFFYDSFFDILNISPELSYDFNSYDSTRFIVAITLLLSFGVWSSVFYLQNIKKQKKAYRASFKIIILAAVFAFFIVFQAPNKNGSEFLFLFAPLAIIITNYVETIKEKWFKEVFLSTLVVMPIVLLVLQLFAKS
ncbi:DUF6427 family protein [Seonamhaeicola maritimus]|uniref:Beta-carotene 15,15'-monooxygenase n=1 Tax=Seonamhaeicola maritimus TaxID=2591822 RepID=A0A5C7GH98_9FLAO|nr:DUF6427 family protein [Seonamhaeicola maritimus]TXG37140.1 hypothetical protein FUA22_11285 [Seonamhaeicola maritimus]